MATEEEQSVESATEYVAKARESVKCAIEFVVKAKESLECEGLGKIER